MEKVVYGFGLFLTGFFFLVGFFMGNQWLWGCVPGLVLGGFGMAFDEN